MELGISGRTALICAASRGLGRGCAEALAAEGVRIVITGRDPARLARTAAEIAEGTGGDVRVAAGDITTVAGQAAALEACPQPDILINNAGGPPPGDFRDWSADDWQAALNANMVTPILMIKAVIDGMMARKFGRIVNITSAAVKAPIPILGLSNGARTGLTGFVAGLSRETVKDNVTINGLLPGPFDTDRLTQTLAVVAAKSGNSVEAERAARAAANPARRFGQAAEFGAMCAFLCSRHAGYITGQNILLDGGAYPGTL